MKLRTLIRDNTLLGAAAAVLLAFPLASLCALLFRFPIPFSAYESGPAAAGRALFAVFTYGLLGGFLLVAVLGASAGLLADFLQPHDPPRARRLTINLSACTTAACVLLLAVLDWIIGPW